MLLGEANLDLRSPSLAFVYNDFLSCSHLQFNSLLLGRFWEAVLIWWPSRWRFSKMSSMIGEGSSAVIGSPGPIIERVMMYSSSSSPQSSTKGRVVSVFGIGVVDPSPTRKIRTKHV